MVIEAILILVILLGISQFVANGLKENAFIKNLISGPWIAMQTIIESGVYVKSARSDLHPNRLKRHTSVKGDTD